MPPIFRYVFFAAVLFVAPAFAQNPGTIIPPPPRPEQSPTVIQPQGGLTTVLRPTAAEKRREMLESLNKELAQFDQLTADLKTAIAQTSGDKLSLDVVRKTEQLEKLAKKIRNTYKQAY